MRHASVRYTHGRRDSAKRGVSRVPNEIFSHKKRDVAAYVTIVNDCSTRARESAAPFIFYPPPTEILGVARYVYATRPRDGQSLHYSAFEFAGDLIFAVTRLSLRESAPPFRYVASRGEIRHGFFPVADFNNRLLLEAAWRATRMLAP